jgi:spoIIIJ-associated protein
MIREVTTEGPSVAEAIDAALEEMGVQQDAVEYEVLEEPGRGIFGGSGKRARVKVWVKPEILLGRPAEAAEDVETDDEHAEVAVSPPHNNDGEGELTDAELDAIADAGVQTIGEILSFVGMEAEIDEFEGDEGEIILDIVGDDFGLLIGRHGRTLDALQVLVAAITNRRTGQRYPLVVDISGYRHRRRVKIEEIAHRAADRAVRQHRPVSLRPMTSFERRVVHVALRDDRRVTTESEGDEPRRMVIIHPR